MNISGPQVDQNDQNELQSVGLAADSVTIMLVSLHLIHNLLIHPHLFIDVPHKTDRQPTIPWILRK